MEMRRSSSLVIRNKQMLPADYIPGSFDVICGRGGADAFRHNLRFRRTVKMHTSLYAAASTQSDQNEIVESIIDAIRQRSINGGFVCQDPNTGLYFEVGDFYARQKVSQALKEIIRKQGFSKRKLGGTWASDFSVEDETVLALSDDEQASGGDGDEEITAPPILNHGPSCCGGYGLTTSFEPTQFRMRRSSQSLMDDSDEGCSTVEDFFNIRRASSTLVSGGNSCQTLGAALS